MQKKVIIIGHLFGHGTCTSLITLCQLWPRYVAPGRETRRFHVHWLMFLLLQQQSASTQMFGSKSLSLSTRSYISRTQLAKANRKNRTRAPHVRNIFSESAPKESRNSAFGLILSRLKRCGMSVQSFSRLNRAEISAIVPVLIMCAELRKRIIISHVRLVCALAHTPDSTISCSSLVACCEHE